MTIPGELKYTDTHEWVRVESDGTVSVGITDHAQEQLGDLVYVESPQVGSKFSKGEECGVIESVKAASDLYSPLGGEVLAVNEELADAPEKINESAYDAWMFRIRPDDPAELDTLLDAAGYGKIVEADSN